MTTKKRPLVRYAKPGELLAIKESALDYDSDRKAFFWMLGSGLKPNERIGEVTVVHVRGELEHHEDPFGCTESYEGLLKKFRAAVTGQDVCDAHKLAYLQAHYGDENGYEPVEAVPPKYIIQCVDSPGGVVAGLNETVKALQELERANPEITFCTYVNEMAASAAYALACAFTEILCPRSAILGSIGVISTMISQAKKNARDGYDVRLLTSGARKADGHLHAPISDAAVSAEMDRVEKLALAFWNLASKARGVPVATIQSFEAGIYLGKDAVRRGLADSVMSWDDVLLGASGDTPEDTTQAGGNQTDRKVTTKLLISPQRVEAAMPIALSALIKKTEAKIAAEKDPEKLSALYASLSAYKKTEKHIEHTKSEEGDDGDDDEDDDSKKDDDDSDDSDDDAEEKSEEGEKSAKSPAGDEEDEEEEESEEKSAKAALAAIQSITGMTGKKALGALKAIALTAENTAKDVAALKKAQKGQAKSALIASATGKYLTKKEAAWLREQPMATVQGFVEMRKSSGVIVHTDESTLLKPKHAAPGTMESLPDEAQKMIEDAVAAAPQGVDKKAYRTQLVEANLAAHNKRISAASNGAGRY